MWTDVLDTWFAEHGRHTLPWRLTTDPWAVLVSEVMLQQTSVARVMPYWRRFLQRWPDPAACAAEPLDSVLREWQGLGYPRRARWLWLTAALVASDGWPVDEPALRALPGVGRYTARALIAFSDLGTGMEAGPPSDVNIARVAARAGLGREPGQVSPTLLDKAISGGRPAGMARRAYIYALFDVGAAHCHAMPACEACPLAAVCALRLSGLPPAPRPPATPFRGSMRQLRGAILAAALADPQRRGPALVRAAMDFPGATMDRCEEALRGLVADGLVEAGRAPTRGDASAATVPESGTARPRR